MIGRKLISRRGFSAGLLSAAALPPVTLFPQRLKGSGVVRLASSGGSLTAAMRRAIFAPFEALSGIKVEETEGFSPAQIKSQVDSGDVQWDVVTMEYSNALQLDEAGDYLENLDYALIDTTGFAPSQVHKRALGGIIVGTVITCRTDAFGGAVPGGYKDFWDTRKFPGPRNWMSGAIGISPFLEGALLADGVAMQDLYPLDVNRALRSLDRVRGDIVKFWESGAQSAQLMADDETVLGIAWNGRVAPLIRAGMKLAVQWNQAMFQTDCWVIPKGAGNASNAQKFIAFAALAEPQARLSLLVDYGFTNRGAAALLPEDRLALLPSHYLDKGFTYDSVWWGKNKSAVTEAFVQWSLG